MTSAIHVRNLHKYFGKNEVLKGIDFQVDPGQVVCVIGPSGSGKSTFLRLLLREEKPTTGDIHVADFHVNRLPARRVPKLRQNLGCVFQDFRLLQRKTLFCASGCKCGTDGFIFCRSHSHHATTSVKQKTALFFNRTVLYNVILFGAEIGT